MQKKIYDLLMDIRKRPGVYLGQKSLTLLHSFLGGYIVRLAEEGYTDVYLRGFQNYISNRFNIQSAHSWAHIIRFYSASEAEAFDRFYELLDEYLSKNGEKISESDDYREKFEYLLNAFENDTEELICNVIDDNPDDRHYSAVAANNRILSLIAVRKHHSLPVKYSNAEEFIQHCKLSDGYSEKFEEVLSEESEVYEGKQF